jgi:hypothetical protein
MKNMGVIDRIVRVVIAAAIAVLIGLNVISGVLAIVLGIIGGIFILTSIVGICPLYMPFKFSTKKGGAT